MHLGEEHPSTGQRLDDPCGTFAGAKVRPPKIAQYIAIFLLSAVAPYLRSPGEDFFREGE